MTLSLRFIERTPYIINALEDSGILKQIVGYGISQEQIDIAKK